jgi:chromosome segregation ATPase
MAIKIQDATDTSKALQNARDEMARICHDIESIEQKLQYIKDELTSIERANREREHSIDIERADLASTKEALKKAVIEARCHIDTAYARSTAKDVSDLQERRQAAELRLAQLEEVAHAQTLESAQRSQELHASKSSLEADLARLRSEESGMQSFASQMARQAGELKLTDLLANVKAFDEREENAKNELLNSRIAKHRFFDQARASLDGWPELQRRLAEMQPKEDAISILATSALHYLEAIVKESPALKLAGAHVKLPMAYPSFDRIFEITGQEIAQASHGQPQLLHVKIAHLRQLLNGSLA